MMSVDDDDDGDDEDDDDDDDDDGDDDVCHLATDLRVMPMAWLGPPVTTPSLKRKRMIQKYE